MRTILCYGDSNTYGTLPTADRDQMGRLGRESRWAGQLRAAFPGECVIEEGHPGRTTVHDDPIEGAPPPVVETGCLAGMFRGGAAKSQALAPLCRRRR